jgi:hypothetical protein
MRQNTHSTVLAINDRLEEEYVNYLRGINVILQESWTLSQTTKDENTKLKALALGKDCFSAKLDLLTNSSVVEDEIKFIKARSKSNEDTESNVTEEQEQTDDKEIVTSGNEE